MIYFSKFIANLILPPGCFIIFLLISTIFQYKREKRVPKLTILVIILIYITSISYTSSRLIHSLEYKFTPPTKLDGDVIIMLGGGATLDSPDFNGSGNLSGYAANRLLTVSRIYHKTNLPIILSGGQVYISAGTESEIAKRQLLDLGVNNNKIIIENQSRTTEENAEFTAKLLAKYHFSKPILVTSAFHMTRSMMNFSKAGVKTAVPYSADYFTNTYVSTGLNSFIPSYDSFNTTGIALREYLGIIQFWIKNIF